MEPARPNVWSGAELRAAAARDFGETEELMESSLVQALHCIALHFTALHCTALHCTALHT
jgi:hypothetical protein